MAPEQAMGSVDPRSDLFGLGATLLHALTHVHPSDQPRNGLAFDLEQQLDCSKHLRAVLARLVEPDPKARFQRAREALDALRAEDRPDGAVALRSSPQLPATRSMNAGVAKTFTVKRSSVSGGAKPFAIGLTGAAALSMLITLALPSSPLFLLTMLLMPVAAIAGVLTHRKHSRALYLEGVPTTGKVEAIRGLDRGTTQVTYSYQVGDRTYRGVVGTSNLLSVNRLDHGDEVLVFHDRSDGSKSVVLLPREAERIDGG